MSTTEQLADFIAGVSAESIPVTANEIAKKAIIDVIGVALAGSKTPAARIVINVVPKYGRGQATIFGTGLKTAAFEAALCNGVMAHVLDFDDYAWSWVGHPSVTIVPPLLALAEERHLSGKDCLLSYIVGFEVGAKIAQSAFKRLREIEWHPTGILGSLAAASATAKLLKLDKDKTRMALGIAASLASGMRQNFGTMTKSLHAGVAARNGLTAAILAEKGYTADANILEASSGFFKAFFNSGYDLELVTKNLGTQFEITSSGINFKPYPSCGATHRCITAMLSIVKNNNILPEEVAAIECQTSKTLRISLIHSRPRTGLEAKFSMEYCMAVALLDREVGLKQFSDDRVTDNQLQEFVTKVNWIHPEAMNTLEGRFSLPEVVTVKLRNGQSYSAEALKARGDFGNPLTMDELVDKYRECASLALIPDKVEQSLQSLLNIETCKDINEVTGLLKGKGFKNIVGMNPID